MVFVWSADSREGVALLDHDKSLSARVDKFSKGAATSLLLEVVDETTGKQRFVLPLDTGNGSFSVSYVDVVGNTLVIADNRQRLLVHNSAGQRLGRVIGSWAELDRSGKFMVVQTEPGRIVLYAIDGMKKLETYTFSSRIVYAAFAGQTGKLVLLTADQTAWTIEMPTSSRTPTQGASPVAAAVNPD